MQGGETGQHIRVVGGVGVIVQHLPPVHLAHLPGGDDDLHAPVERDEAVERGIRRGRPHGLSVGRQHLRGQGLARRGQAGHAAAGAGDPVRRKCVEEPGSLLGRDPEGRGQQVRASRSP